jgi:hypothetical protein
MTGDLLTLLGTLKVVLTFAGSGIILQDVFPETKFPKQDPPADGLCVVVSGCSAR